MRTIPAMEPQSTDQQLQQNAVLRFAGTRDLESLEKSMSDALGPRYADYRRAWHESSRSSNNIFPLHIDFELNDTCNQSCIMCPRNTDTHVNTGYNLNTRKFFDLNDFQKVIDESVGYGLTSINLGAYAEPLIHPQFSDFVLYAKSKGILDIRIITNGLRLDDYATFLVDQEVTNVYISLDATTNETYTAIRGPGFERVKNNLIKLIDERNSRSALFPIIRASFVKMKINEAEEPTFVNYWKSLVDHIDIQPGEDLSHSTQAVLSTPYRFNCISPWQRLSVLASGDIIPCCSFYGRYLSLGNISQISLSQAWNSDSMRQVRQDLSNGTQNICEICQRSSLA